MIGGQNRRPHGVELAEEGRVDLLQSLDRVEEVQVDHVSELKRPVHWIALPETTHHFRMTEKLENSGSDTGPEVDEVGEGSGRTVRGRPFAVDSPQLAEMEGVEKGRHVNDRLLEAVI